MLARCVKCAAAPGLAPALGRGRGRAPEPAATHNRFGTVVLGMDKAQLLTSTDRITSITIKVG